MCTYATGKGHEKSQGLIRVSVPGYVMVSIQLKIPTNWNLSVYQIINNSFKNIFYKYDFLPGTAKSIDKPLVALL